MAIAPYDSGAESTARNMALRLNPSPLGADIVALRIRGVWFMRAWLITIEFLVATSICAGQGLAETGAATPVAAPRHLAAADYDRAARVLDWALRGKVRNAVVAPRWIANRDVFWYRRDGDSGPEFVIVDAQSGAKVETFDAAHLGAALSATTGDQAIQSSELLITRVDKESQLWRIHLAYHSGRYTCTIPSYACVPTAQIETDNGAVFSPDRSQAIVARGHDLWVRDTKIGTERQLTSDGETYFSYVKPPDSSLTTLPRLRNPGVQRPWSISWSPDGKTILGQRVDERAVAPYPYVEWVPQDGSFRPITYQIRLPLLGDPVPPNEFYAIDVATATKREIKLPAGLSYRASPFTWSADHRHCLYLATSFGQRDSALLEVDVETGQVRNIISESSPSHFNFNAFIYNIANVRVLAATQEAIWWSERDGWGHLYLYDIVTGQLRRQLTSGPWLVRDIIRVGAKRRELFFTASGREPNQDPYYRHLYRVSLDGGEPVDLTPEDAEHAFEARLTGFAATFLGGQIDDGQKISPSGRYLIDTYTTVDQPPLTVLRSAVDGAVIARLEKADATAVYASGWHAPQRVLVKAVDGETEISAVVYFPPNLEMGKRYPVIDAFYGGPQMINAPRSFVEAVSTFNPVSRAALAQLGFIVVTIDARGTPGRSKSFANVGYGNWADPEIADHIAAIKQLAARFGTFDLDHVGVYGHSYGGYTSARAILSHPGFYKVAVASAGSHNYQGFYQGQETYFGVPEYGGGSSLRPSPIAIPDAYRELDNARLASGLRGKLMLVYGDMDENALPAVTLQLVDALEKANKSFDLLYLPNRTHAYFRGDAYYVRRMWDYFVEHLAAATPPEGYDVNAATALR
jgi:dipeptidyl aminopeptidase/acylaminoacyl peptidase